MIDFSIALTPSNTPIVKGCPGVPKTLPRIDTVLEIRSLAAKQSVVINSVTVKLLTSDTFVKKPPSDVPSNFIKCIHESNYPIDRKVISIDIPVLIPLPRSIAPTSSNLRFETKHHLEVSVLWNNHKSLKEAKFPIVIYTYNNLPIFGEFNELITKTMDSPDHRVILEYSLPTNAIGPDELLPINFRILNNQALVKNLQKIKLKSIKLDLLEIFDCRCEKSFTKETALKSDVIENDDKNKQELGYEGLRKALSFVFNGVNKSELQGYQLFQKHQDSTLVLNRISDFHDPTRHFANNESFIPGLIDSYKTDIPLNCFGNITKRSINFGISFELKLTFKLSGAKDIELKLPIIISQYDRIKSQTLWKYIQREITLTEQFLRSIDQSKVVYEEKHLYPVRFPQRPFIIHE